MLSKVTLGFVLLFLCGFYNSSSAQKVGFENGVRIVENGKDGLWGKNPQIKLEYEGKFGNHDEKDVSTYFGKAEDMAFDQQGNIYVLDAGQCLILKYDKNRKFISSFGRKGRGPGEMIYPTGISISPAGNISVYDSRQNRINIYSPEGKSKSSINTTGYSLIFSMFGEDYILKINPLTGYAGVNKPLFFITDLKGKKNKEFGEGPFPKGKATDANGKGGGWNRLSFALGKNMNIYAAFKFSERIDRYDKEGKLNLKIKTAPVRGVLKNCGIAIDSKERIWVLTQQKGMKREDFVYRQMITTDQDDVSWNIKGNKSIVNTDIYALELYDKEGALLFRYPLTHFINNGDIIRINGNKIYILEDLREGTFHVYKISDL